MSWNNDNEKISLTWKEALLSFATLSVFDEHHRHLSASMSGSKIRENMNVESSALVLAGSLMFTISTTALLDAPGRLHIFNAEMEADGSYDVDALSPKALIYAASLMFSVILFALTLVFALFNLIFLNLLDDDSIAEYVRSNSMTFKFPLFAIIFSFFTWILSMEIFCYAAYGLRFGICVSVFSESWTVFFLYTMVKNVRKLYSVRACTKRRKTMATEGVLKTMREFTSLDVPPSMGIDTKAA